MSSSCGLLLGFYGVFTLPQKLRRRAFDFFIFGEDRLSGVLRVGLLGCLRSFSEGKEVASGGNCLHVKLDFGPIEHL